MTKIKTVGCAALLAAAIFLPGETAFGVSEKAPERPSRVIIDTFSSASDSVPSGWKTAMFEAIPRPTAYTVEFEKEEEGVLSLRAVSKDSASAIYKDVSIDPKLYPILTWRWKVNNILNTGEETGPEHNYAARLYVFFKPRPNAPHAAAQIRKAKTMLADAKGDAIVYVWASRLKRNKPVNDEDNSNAFIMPVENGADNAGVWMMEGRNVYEDYRNIFGAEPAQITHIAVMTDTDNTDEEANTWYNDIIFHNALVRTGVK